MSAPHVRPAGDDAGDGDADGAPVEIKVRENGPYRVQGPIRLIDADGNEFDLGGRGEVIALCRCGGSTTKPFCDGTHSRTGFQAAERAVARESESE
ncbi:MAG TPA: CDGSH iron-sulfur domain-containing protein [Candidatus Caenarcaniphilales bacterium]|nr:CDGSH iron-sulfur domain-containing protein [Candidatus Caenarcaniphilales bacterium]